MISKVWYESKTVWLGIVQFLIGAFGLLAEFLNKGDFSPASVVVLLSGVLVVVLRVWFTDTAISK